MGFTTLMLFAPILVMFFIGSGSCLRIGAFNIQVFGVTKMKDRDVVNVLVNIISRYDILLIQEIRDSKGEAIHELLEKVNKKNPNNPFNMTLSPRLGRTTSKEQYAFLYRIKSGVMVERTFVYDDGDESLNTDTEIVDAFEREPFIVLFRTSNSLVDKFALIGIHISPSKAVEELQELETVYDYTKAALNVDNVMVLGDLNADCSYVPKKDWVNVPIKNDPAYTWWIEDEVDTTVGNSNCAYDRFISIGDQFKNAVKNGSVDVFKYDEVFGLNQTMALEVSDHYPIEMTIEDSPASSGWSLNERKIGHFYTTALAILTSIVTLPRST